MVYVHTMGSGMSLSSCYGASSSASCLSGTAARARSGFSASICSSACWYIHILDVVRLTLAPQCLTFHSWGREGGREGDGGSGGREGQIL